MEVQIKSKQRVADHGEVLTGKREFNAMLDLVKHALTGQRRITESDVLRAQNGRRET